MANEVLQEKREPTVCVAENRSWCEPGVRLLIASLARYSPDLRVELFYPIAKNDFIAWVSDYHQVSLNRFALPEPWRGFNVKADAMLTLLSAGHSDILWIDTDIILTGDVRTMYHGLKSGTLIVAEEAMCSSHYDGDAMRARLWGLPVGRALPFQLNSGVVGLDRSHLPLLERWREVLCSAEYQSAQDLAWDQRPLYYMGDQEVLTALLCSTPFANIPLKILRRGHEIIQFMGSACYTLRERAINLRRGPPLFVHSQGHKAWTPLPEPRNVRDRLLNLYQRTSPYIIAARGFAPALVNRDWLRPKGIADWLLSALALGRAPLAGLPIAAANDLYRCIRWAHTRGEPRR